MEQWKRRARLFRQAYREAELHSIEALNARGEADLKLRLLLQRIQELEAEVERKAS